MATNQRLARKSKLNNIELMIFVINSVLGLTFGIFFFIYSLVKSKDYFLISLVLIIIGIIFGVYLETKTRKEEKYRHRNTAADASLL